MSQTSIPAGSPLARKIFGAALFARTIQAPNWLNNLTGPAPKQSDAEAKLKGQTSKDMPVIRVTDLSKTSGETISIDAFDTTGGKPIMGDANAEGKGEKLSSSSMDISINQTTKVVDAGGRMAQQRTLHDLRGIAMANLAGYFPRFHNQLALCHMAGARGTMTGKDWVLPLQSDPDFSSIAVNAIKAPTYNRHYVIDSTNLIQGGAQLAAIDSTDIWTLGHVDALSLMLDDMEVPLQPVKLADDPAANDEPIKAVLFLTPRQWAQIKNSTASTNNWRTFLQNAWNRKSYGTKHPLFSGEPGMWNGILVRVLPRYTIRFSASDTTKHITAANRYTATETDVTINAALGAGYAVERAILLGAQALGNVYGRNQQSEYFFSWYERRYNFDNNLEVAGRCMNGMSKLRFNWSDGQGNLEPTDNGVIVIDSAVSTT
jgi:N4-gp56 family major capsid protein